MNILNWNIRGMNSPRKRQALTEYISKYQVDIIAIQETKKETFSLRILRSLSHKLDIWIYLPSIGKSGGILFGGDSSKVEILSHSEHKYCVDIHLLNKLDQTEWQYTIVYGPVLRNLKQELWKELEQVRLGNTKPWILSGDFNVIRTSNEKSGTNFDVKISKMFNHSIHRHNLVEHKLLTRKYTWASGGNFALLDRFFTSLDWDQKYPNSTVSDLCKNGSDHCPLLLQVLGPSPPPSHHFRIDPLWLEQEEFCRLIRKWWQEHPLFPENLAYNWNYKLSILRKKIKGLAKNFYGQKKREKTSILQQLHHIEILTEQRPLLPQEVEKSNDLKHRLESIYLEEEIYWKQRSKQTWLEEGDSNTKYFHVIANHRKKQSRINSLVIDDTPTQSVPDIKAHVFQYYKDILGTPGIKYASLDPQFWDEQDKLTPHETTQLEIPFTLDEIHQALFACEPTGAPGPDGFSFKFYQHFWDLVKDDLYSVLIFMPTL